MLNNLKLFLSCLAISILFCVISGCAINSKKNTVQPNILWLVAEDMSPSYLSAFGNTVLETPSINELANEGVRYTQVFSPSGVCAPSRAALATGMYPSSIGANHMRTGSHTDVTGLPKYEAVPPPSAQMLSQYLRASGYYVTNNFKKDYQFKAPKTAWDESGPLAHWRNRPEGKPFFSIFNFNTTHESGLFEPYSMNNIESRHYFSGDRARIRQIPKGRTNKENTPIHISKNTVFPVPPYLPNTEIVQGDLWKVYNNIAEMDKQLGAILGQLKEDGLLENTIIFFYSDHGGPLPRQKRLIYDSGLQVPLIIRFPDMKNAGKIDDQLVSFIDFAPTTMNLAKINLPPHMHGQTFLGKQRKERQFIHAAADRFDGFTDTIRAVRNKQFKYIRNYQPDKGYYLPVKYRERIPTMQALLDLNTAGKLNEAQAQWFRDSKPKEELFDLIADPNELHNLAQDPGYEKPLQSLRFEMDQWLKSIGDVPMLSERDLISKLWDGRASKPKTSPPILRIKDNFMILSSKTEGASIGFQIIEGDKLSNIWQLYKSPLSLAPGTKIRAQAHRIGFEESAIKNFSSP